jgi:hypothetical protein
MKHRADLDRLKSYLSFKGTIAGDSHMGNFTNVDFDDAGRGPLVLDLVPYLVAVKAITGKKRPVETSYFAGLASKELDPPKELRSLLAIRI